MIEIHVIILSHRNKSIVLVLEKNMVRLGTYYFIGLINAHTDYDTIYLYKDMLIEFIPTQFRQIQIVINRTHLVDTSVT